jgi:putative hemolysin
MLLDFFLIGLMILINGIFAMAEIAVIAAQPTKLRVRADDGDHKASLLLGIQKNPGDFLATIQIGVTIAGTTASVIGGAEAVKFLSPMLAKIPLLAPYAQEIALGMVVVVIAYLTLVCGELLPKRLALLNAEKTALTLAGLIHFFSRLTYLPMRFLSVSVDFMLRILGKTSTSNPAISLEEIEVVIQQGASEGVILPFEENLINKAFAYGNKSVNDVMTPRTAIIALDVETSLSVALEKAKLSGFSRFPVFEQEIDRVAGYVHIKDLIWGIDQGTTLRQCLREIVVIPISVTLPEAFSRLTKSKKHMAIVLDEFGGTFGILTLEDLLEEIVGEIEDEHSPITEKGMQKTGDEWIFAGVTPISDVGNLLGVSFQPQGLYATLAGFILASLGRIPQPGDQTNQFGFTFSVEEMDRLRIASIRVHRSRPHLDT